MPANFFSFWGTLAPDPPPGRCFWTSAGGPPDPVVCSHPRMKMENASNEVGLTGYGNGARHGLGANPPEITLNPSHRGQGSGGKLCEIFKCWSFLQSKIVNNVRKLLQSLTAYCIRPQTPLVTWAIAPHLPPPDTAWHRPVLQYYEWPYIIIGKFLNVAHH